ncbi:hypothetical protein PSHT_05075 [Puccinia striiformis]|uniref:Uncharacterized protein n=2 Tax=Puccinia striiformis TaxID=27350 RepID=A0A2S4VXE0_9BASI|nr:hypothetical protein PSTT_03214 [Puccinia striiformis]POW19065.1 hypothetical protein PSHT_05075 [Puccinia striiformis]
MNNSHMSQLFQLKRLWLLTQSRQAVKNSKGYAFIVNPSTACKEFLVNVDQKDNGKLVNAEPVNLNFPLQFPSSLDELSVIAVVCPLATSKTLQYSSQTLGQCPQSWPIACCQVWFFFRHFDQLYRQHSLD